jgi:hypothetical protein
MIEKFVLQWEKNKHLIQRVFELKHPESYKDVVHAVIDSLYDEDSDDYYERPSSTRIHEIDDGDYQGTLLYVIGASGYQPSTYWYVKVGYGSCSACDTLKGIRNYEDDTPTPEQVKEYMVLALHIIQGLKLMGED